MDIFEAIYTRRSIRRYQDRPVARALIEKILDAARWAPSAHNRQPWRFVVIERAETKDALASAMGKQLRADLERDGAAPEAIEKDVTRSYQRITRAPTVIVVCMTMRDMDAYGDTRRKKAEFVLAGQSVAMAVQNLLLAAHALGLGACWMCAPLFAQDTVRAVLQLDADWDPQSLITLGYAAEDKAQARVALDLHVKFLDTDSADDTDENK